MVENSYPIQILLVDDSQTVTRLVSQIIGEDKTFRVMGIAADPFEAVEIMKKQRPDVILLDIEMPRMNGLTFLRKIMSQHPIPVVIFSSVAPKNSYNAIKALEYGAVAVLQKPKLITSPEFNDIKIRFLETLKGAAEANLKMMRTAPAQNPASHQTSVKEISQKRIQIPSRKVIVAGASTGGTQAIEYLVKNLKQSVPGMLITQHMPGEFTKAFAERLNTFSPLLVKEAEEGEVIKNGCVYIANGFFHMMVEKTGLDYIIHLKNGPLVNRHKPSVDVLFSSASRHVGPHAVGLLLTGMGNDGATGLRKMKDAGAVTIAQDEASSVVFGMPRAAIELNAAQKVLSLKQILNYLNSL